MVNGEFEGAAECQARLYYLDLLTWVKDLHSAHLAVAAAFTTLLKEYRDVFPSSKLQLYPRSRPLHGPTALYWGEVFTLQLRAPSGKLEPKKVIRHKSGSFQARWVFTLAKRSDRLNRFLDFERRRLALNAASHAVLAALNHLRNATSRKFRLNPSPVTVASGLDPEDRRLVPDLSQELLPTGLPARLIQLLRSGWVGAYTLALAEEECCELALEVGGNPSAEGVRLELSDRKKTKFTRQIRWVHTATGKGYVKLTDRLMREFHLREGVRPVLCLKELKRRRIAKALATSADALDSIRSKCGEAQIAVSARLAEAKVILLPVSSMASAG